jgi:hypothetical protein
MLTAGIITGDQACPVLRWTLSTPQGELVAAPGEQVSQALRSKSALGIRHGAQ